MQIGYIPGWMKNVTLTINMTADLLLSHTSDLLPLRVSLPTLHNFALHCTGLHRNLSTHHCKCKHIDKKKRFTSSIEHLFPTGQNPKSFPTSNTPLLSTLFPLHLLPVLDKILPFHIFAHPFLRWTGATTAPSWFSFTSIPNLNHFCYHPLRFSPLRFRRHRRCPHPRLLWHSTWPRHETAVVTLSQRIQRIGRGVVIWAYLLWTKWAYLMCGLCLCLYNICVYVLWVEIDCVSLFFVCFVCMLYFVSFRSFCRIFSGRVFYCEFYVFYNLLGFHQFCFADERESIDLCLWIIIQYCLVGTVFEEWFGMGGWLIL